MIVYQYVKYHLKVCIWAVLLIVALFITADTPFVAAAACMTPPSSYGSDTLTVSVPQSGEYFLWVRMLDTASSNNTVLLQVDNASCYNVGGPASMPANAWNWVNYQNGTTTSRLLASLTQGTHSIVLLGNSAGVEVDRIELLADGNCVPSGSGDNCTPAASSNGTPPASSNGSTALQTTTVPVKNGTTIVATAPIHLQPTTNAKNGYIVKAQYFLNKKLMATISSAPFGYYLNTSNLANGTYTLTTKLYYSSGVTTTSNQRIEVRNPLSFKQFMLTAQKNWLPTSAGALFLLAAALFVFFRFIRRKRQSVSDDSMDDFPHSFSPQDPTTNRVQPDVTTESAQVIASSDMRPDQTAFSGYITPDNPYQPTTTDQSDQDNGHRS